MSRTQHGGGGGGGIQMTDFLEVVVSIIHIGLLRNV
jgi:hypothetical protein